MSKFTQGKWFCGLQKAKAGKHKQIKIYSGASLREGIIKQIATLSGTNAEANANARLIAAAPEMYRELCDVREEINKIIPLISDSVDTYDLQVEVDLIDELLDSIDGEQEAKS